jgi:hypothetical protein
MFSLRPRNATCVGLVEYSELKQPEGQSSQGYPNAVAPALHSPASKRSDGANGSEPGGDVIIDHEHLGKLWTFRRSLESQNAGDRSGNLIETDTIRPGASWSVYRHIDVYNSWS